MPCAETAMEQLENSVPIAGIKADDFDAIYIPGGHGIAVDGPFDLTLRSLISEFASQGKLVSAVCHGPVAFSGPELNGKPIVAGKKVILQSYIQCAKLLALCHPGQCPCIRCFCLCGLLSHVRLSSIGALCCAQVTCFSTSEENIVGKNDAVPFLPEARLRELGGLYEKVQSDHAELSCACGQWHVHDT